MTAILRSDPKCGHRAGLPMSACAQPPLHVETSNWYEPSGCISTLRPQAQHEMTGLFAILPITVHVPLSSTYRL